MLNRWFKREAVPAPCVDLEAVARLAAAERRVRELEALLAGSVVELDAYRAARDAAPTVVELDAYRAARAAPTLVEVPAVEVEAKPAKAARKPRAAKPAKLTALAFWALHGEAVEAIRAVYGDNWRVVAPFGERALVTLPARLAATRKVSGMEIKSPRDLRVPAASYWPDGEIPGDVTVEADYPREDPEIANAAWLAMRTGGKAPTPVEHDADWHRAHGYTLVGKVWIAAMLVRQNEAHLDNIEAEREFKRLAKLEAAALTYGPQPMVECEFADAAD